MKAIITWGKGYRVIDSHVIGAQSCIIFLCLRQDSGYSMFGVRPEKLKELSERMGFLGIREEDILEKFIRSGGHGGQKVNKTSTCVYLKHLPTGIEVKCQESRSQPLNRFLARRYLIEKIEQRLLGSQSPAEKLRENVGFDEIRNN